MNATIEEEEVPSQQQQQQQEGQRTNHHPQPVRRMLATVAARRRIVRARRPANASPQPAQSQQQQRPSQKQQDEVSEMDHSSDDDEVLDYEDSEEDSEEDDYDADDDEQEDMDFAYAFGRFMRNVLTHQDEEEDSEEDEDESECDCPNCQFRRNISAVLEEEEDDDQSNNNNSSETVLPGAPTCAVCLEPETNRRAFAILPCCGTNEQASSMRFCKGCLTKCIIKDGGSTDIGNVVGQCPRCKHLLSFSIFGLRASNRPFQVASAHDQLFYISMVVRCRAFLVAIAWGMHQNICEEFLDLLPDRTESRECVRRLLAWGFLQKHDDSRCYSITIPVQALREWVAVKLRAPGEDKIPHRFDFVRDLNTQSRASNIQDLCFFASCACFKATLSLIMNGPLRNSWTAIKLANRGLTLLCVYALLPNPLEWNRAAPFLATVLNGALLYIAFKISIKCCYIVLYLGAAYCSAKVLALGMEKKGRLVHLSNRCYTFTKRLLMGKAGENIVIGLCLGYGMYVGSLLLLGVMTSSAPTM